MNQQTVQLLFALLRSAILGIELTHKEKTLYSPDILSALMKIAQQHSVAHLIIIGLEQNNLIPKDDIVTETRMLKAAHRYERLNYEYMHLCSVLEASKIPFIPLKGSVIRKYYPEEWMRTSCDIDILVHEEDLEKAVSILLDICEYTYHKKGPHDIALFTSSKLHVELHYDLVETGAANNASLVLKSVWDTAVLRDGYNYFYEMPDEMFYFYHIAHMAKHFENGGCGIRSVIDLWILDNIDTVNQDKRNSLLSKGNLLKFADSVRKLSKIWFENFATDSVSQQLETYILRGGVYGNIHNRIIVHQQKKGGRMRYALSKIFIPYNVIKFQYPVLQRYPMLTPFMEVRRWFKLIFCGHAKRSLHELKYNGSISKDTAVNMQTFLKNIGLQ